MATLPVAPPDGEADKEKRSASRRLAAIAQSVMDTLGKPIDFLKATVRPVTGDNFRVNVVIGPNAGSARIAESFFVTADADGKVTNSIPAIQKCY